MLRVLKNPLGIALLFTGSAASTGVATAAVLNDQQGNLVPVGATFNAYNINTFVFSNGGTPINQCVTSTLTATLTHNGAEHGTPAAIITSLSFSGCLYPITVNDLPYPFEAEGEDLGGGHYSVEIDGIHVNVRESDLTGMLLDGLGDPPGVCQWGNRYCSDDFSTIDFASCGVLSGSLGRDVRVTGTYQIDQPWVLADDNGDRYWKDTVDNGDDPFTSGCHLEYSSNNCAVGTQTGGRYGDRCQNAMDLVEWTNQACHPRLPLDSHYWYCDFECRTRYQMNGRCVAERVMCPDGVMVDSAKCECFP